MLVYQHRNRIHSCQLESPRKLASLGRARSSDGIALKEHSRVVDHVAHLSALLCKSEKRTKAQESPSSAHEHIIPQQPSLPFHPEVRICSSTDNPDTQNKCPDIRPDSTSIGEQSSRAVAARRPTADLSDRRFCQRRTWLWWQQQAQKLVHRPDWRCCDLPCKF